MPPLPFILILTAMHADKKAVQDFWERAACGEELYLQQARAASYLEQARRRYELEPYIESFADFAGLRRPEGAGGRRRPRRRITSDSPRRAPA